MKTGMDYETEKLYDLDPELRTFRARVLGCAPKDGAFEIVLDRTAFYPEGGGQPADRGALNFANVLDVRERGGRIVHIADRPLPAGSAVSGGIDWSRRFALMQQHTGEHIVSGLAHRLFGLDNVGFHMAPSAITVDLNGELSPDDLSLVERLANEAVWKDLPVRVFYPSAEELETIPYRSKKELTGAVRIVEVPGYDICACCGTHVTRTGRIGAVKLLSSQRYKGGTRLTMACGAQALRDYGERLRGVSAVSGLLSAKADGIEQAVGRLLRENEELKHRSARLQKEIFERRAEGLPRGCGNVLVFEEGLSPDDIRRFALILSERCGGAAAVLSGGEKTGYRYAIADPSGDARPFAKELSGLFSGRGGGPKELVQGSAAGGREELERYFAGRSFLVGPER